MTFYQDMQGVATEILTEFDQAEGEKVLVKSTVGTGPAYDPGDGVAPVEQTVIGAIRGVEKQFVDGTNIVETDLQMSMSVPDSGIIPEMEDTLKIGGVPHKIIRVRSIPPKGVIVVYLVIFRR